MTLALILGTLLLGNPEPTATREQLAAPKLEWVPGFGGEIRISSTLVTKTGVPNALRFGGAFGPVVLRRGIFSLSPKLHGAIGTSEQFGHSWRVGGELEGELRLGNAPAAFYLSTGGHFFRSNADENRAGGLWRAAVGLRLLSRGHAYVGFEPFAVERLPDGLGPYTPVRSRWAFEFTFLSVGYRP